MEVSGGVFHRRSGSLRLLLQRPRKPIVRRAINPLEISVGVDHFHDIQLATSCPSPVGGIRGHHPERAPQALTRRGFDACLYSTVSKLELFKGPNAT